MAETGANPASVGGAPGGAGPYVTGAAHPGWRARWHACGARAGPFAKDLPREPRKLPKGSRKPLAPPGAPSPRLGGERKKGRGVPGAQKTKNTGGGALA